MDKYLTTTIATLLLVIVRLTRVVLYAKFSHSVTVIFLFFLFLKNNRQNTALSLSIRVLAA